jgi:hypothetical protein
VDNSIGIGDLAAILTAAGVTIYVLGLIGLALPIRRNFTGDLSTAWYAVALIPKTVVAGQGARIWLRLPVTLTALILLSSPLQRISFSVYIMVVLIIISITSQLAYQTAIGGKNARWEEEHHCRVLLEHPL